MPWNNSKYNIHWKPISIMCQLCSNDIKYNYIMKLENRNTEEPLMIRAMDFSDVLKVKSGNSEKKRPNSNAILGMSSKDVTVAYFKQISLDDRQTLYNIFKYDFELFGYKPHPEILTV